MRFSSSLRETTCCWRALLGLVATVLLTSNSFAQPVPLHLLEGSQPGVTDGVNWGVPWPKGAVKKTDSLALKSADGKAIPAQSWPLAYWPDGSIKWSGLATSAGPDVSGPFTVSVGTPATIAQPIKVTDDAQAIEVDTGAVRARFPKQGSNLIESMYVGDRMVAQNGKLIVQTEDRSQQSEGILKIVGYTSKITKASIENSGPMRTVIKVEGMHAADKGDRQWLPFVMRFYFYAGAGSVRMVHSFVYDGDQYKDFIKGMGISFSVPFKEEPALIGTCVLLETARVCGGAASATDPRLSQCFQRQRRAAHEAIRSSVAGKRIPELLADMPGNQRTATESVAVYNDMKLTQLGPDSFSIDKRTTDKSSWLHVNNGHRSLGMAVLADVSGGIAVGVKDFWQRYPASLEINNAASQTVEKC